MKISIITVVYNNVKTIRSAINSVLNQSYKNVEYIIIDGGSTDGTLDIINEYKDKISTIVSEKDNGLYDAMNKGIIKSTGEIIAILNSDDLYYNYDVLEIVMNEFKKDCDLDGIYGNLLYVEKNDISKIIRRWISKDYYFKFFENGNVPPHPTLFLRKNVYQKVGYFNLEYKLASDYEFMLRIFKNHSFKFKYISKYLIIMRLGGETNKNLKNIYLGNVEILKAWKMNSLNVPFLFMPKKIIKRIIQYL